MQKLWWGLVFIFLESMEITDRQMELFVSGFCSFVLDLSGAGWLLKSFERSSFIYFSDTGGSGIIFKKQPTKDCLPPGAGADAKARVVVVGVSCPVGAYLMKSMIWGWVVEGC